MENSMSEAIERLLALTENKGVVYSTTFDEDIKAVISDRDTLEAENREWLTIAIGLIHSGTQSEEVGKWLDRLAAMCIKETGTRTPLPIVDKLNAELDAMREGQKRLAFIYEERGKMIAEMRRLLDSCS